MDTPVIYFLKFFNLKSITDHEMLLRSYLRSCFMKLASHLILDSISPKLVHFSSVEDIYSGYTISYRRIVLSKYHLRNMR